MYCKYRDGFDSATGDEDVKFWQTKLTALNLDTGGVDGKYGDKTKLAVTAVVPASDGMQIYGVEAGVIDVTLGKLGPAIPGGVEHQHDEYALTAHAHIVSGTAK